MYKKIILIAGLVLPSVAVASDRPSMEDSGSDRPDVTTQSVHSVPGAHTPEAPEATEEVRQEVQVSGDALEMQPGETIAITPLDFPRRGMTMDKVKNELGQPVEISPTVGEPPITSWTYPDRVVFFEHSNVIHVVEKR